VNHKPKEIFHCSQWARAEAWNILPPQPLSLELVGNSESIWRPQHRPCKRPKEGHFGQLGRKVSYNAVLPFRGDESMLRSVWLVKTAAVTAP